MAIIDWNNLSATQKLAMANGTGYYRSNVGGGAGGYGGFSGGSGPIGAGGNGGYSGPAGGSYNPHSIMEDYFGKVKVGTKPNVVVDSRVGRVEVPMEDGSTEYVDPAELVKYIRERKLRSENEIVQTQWDRYQVAVKIVGSTDNGQEDEE
jgi:hypothetical protein